MKNSPFFKQADLLIQVLPTVDAESCFALKGGTAINCFVRNFPRLSVDIDLVYVPVEDRASSLQGIHDALQRIGSRLCRLMPSVQVIERRLTSENKVVKLLVRVPNHGEVKIEANTVLRGVLDPPTPRALVPRASEVFGRSVTVRTLSLPELYGGKICAALDRQHPRDLFDVHGLFQEEGITTAVRHAFVVFLASHDRSMNELLAPNRHNLNRVFAEQFAGMAFEPVPLAVLELTRERLIQQINRDLTTSEREFLLSIKRLEPKWDLLGIPGIDRLPGLQWKLYNLRKMKPAMRLIAEQNLRRQLGL